jgi:hypothetical protein
MEKSVTFNEKTACMSILLTFLYEPSLDKMGINVKINCYYFTGLQNDSKGVFQNYMPNVRLHVFHVQVFYSPLPPGDNPIAVK